MGGRKNRQGRRTAREQAQGDGNKEIKKEMCMALRAVKENCKVVLSNDVLADHAVELALDSDGSNYLISIFNTAEPVEVTNVLTGEFVCELPLAGLDAVRSARLAIADIDKVPAESLKLVNKQIGVLQDSDNIYAINATENAPCLSSKSPQKVLMMEWHGKELAAVIAALMSEAPKLAGHVTGNLVVHVLYESADLATRHKLTQNLSGHIYNLSVMPYGCRVIQKALSHSPRDGQNLIANELAGHVAKCMESRHGNFVIQKCLEQMPPDSIAFLLEEVEDKTEYMAKHRYGCRVIQRSMDYRPPAGIMQRILAAAHELAMDRFGNYVIQHVFQRCDVEDIRALLKVVVAHFRSMAQDKYASNVLEMSFQMSRVHCERVPDLEVERRALFAAAFDVLEHIVLDRYGNYVVQRMIESSCEQERSALFARLSQLQPVVQSPSHRPGKSILKELEKET